MIALKKIIFNKLFYVAFSLGAILFFTSACHKKEAVDVDAIKQRGSLLVGLEPGYPPFEFMIQKEGKEELVGMDIEMANAIAQNLGVKVEFKTMPFDGLITALQAKKIDMIISGMTPTPERAKAIDFSDLYFSAGNVLLVSSNSTVSTLTDLSGKVIGAQLGTTHAALIKGIAGASAKELSSIADLVEQLKSGKIDGVIVGELVAKSFVETNTDKIKVAESIKFGDQGDAIAIAMNKNQPKLLVAVNTLIASLKSEGKLDQMYQSAVLLQKSQNIQNEPK